MWLLFGKIWSCFVETLILMIYVLIFNLNRAWEYYLEWHKSWIGSIWCCNNDTISLSNDCPNTSFNQSWYVILGTSFIFLWSFFCYDLVSKKGCNRNRKISEEIRGIEVITYYFFRTKCGYKCVDIGHGLMLFLCWFWCIL